MENIHELLQVFVRRFGLLNVDCCENCCGAEVSLVQSHILFEIRRQKNTSMQQVADELGMDITTFSRQVKTLEKKGLVSKTPDPGDRRVNLLALTAAGAAVLEQIEQSMNRYIGQIFSQFSEFEREAVLNSLKLINNALLKTGPCCSLK